MPCEFTVFINLQNSADWTFKVYYKTKTISVQAATAVQSFRHFTLHVLVS